jgi:hypothetical protein
MIVFLWTHPRCCGTAMELWARARGDFDVKVNVFDASYYAHEGRGSDPPVDLKKRPEDRFEVRHHELFHGRRFRPVFVRNAAYTVRCHLDPELWHNAVHTFFIRDPRYALPSHRKFVDHLTMEEAGYEAQWELYEALQSRLGISTIVMDAHDLLCDPEDMLRAYCQNLGLAWVPQSLRWEPGMRPEWSLWPEWKKDAAESTGFRPFKSKPYLELTGASDPLYAQCQPFYEALYARRLLPETLAAVA